MLFFDNRQNQCIIRQKQTRCATFQRASICPAALQRIGVLCRFFFLGRRL
jgi:hypothetical protein